jgi:hypothetical protein
MVAAVHLSWWRRFVCHGSGGSSVVAVAVRCHSDLKLDKRIWRAGSTQIRLSNFKIPSAARNLTEDARSAQHPASRIPYPASRLPRTIRPSFSFIATAPSVCYTPGIPWGLGGAVMMSFPKCQKCKSGDLVPLSDFGSQGAAIHYKAWACTNPECGFNIKIRNGDLYIDEPIASGALHSPRFR